MVLSQLVHEFGVGIELYRVGNDYRHLRLKEPQSHRVANVVGAVLVLH